MQSIPRFRANHYNANKEFSYSSHHCTLEEAEEACSYGASRGRLVILASKDPNGPKPKRGTPLQDPESVTTKSTESVESTEAS